MIHWIRTTWCKSMHNQAMWPIHGRYICPTCLQEYPVVWESRVTPAEYATPAISSAAEVSESWSPVHNNG
jgi:hypothetical protein